MSYKHLQDYKRYPQLSGDSYNEINRLYLDLLTRLDTSDAFNWPSTCCYNKSICSYKSTCSYNKSTCSHNKSICHCKPFLKQHNNKRDFRRICHLSLNCFGDKIIIDHHKSTWCGNKSTLSPQQVGMWLFLVISRVICYDISTCCNDRLICCDDMSTCCRDRSTCCNDMTTFLTIGRLIVKISQFEWCRILLKAL